MKMRFGIVVCVLSLLSACSPFSRPALQQVDVAAPFQEVWKDPHRFMNRNVLWGGVIADILVRPGEAVLTVVQKDLDYNHRPKEEDVSAGRFIVRRPGFLDPAIYRPGREITVIGKIVGTEMRPIGEMRYSHPVVEAGQMHLWEVRASYRNSTLWDYPLMPYPYGPYPYPVHRPPPRP